MLREQELEAQVAALTEAGVELQAELAWSHDEVRALHQSVRDMQDKVQVKVQELSERDSALSSLREEVVELSAQVDQQQQTLWAREASEASLLEEHARLKDDMEDREYTINLLKEELDDKTADAAALRAAIGERTSLWDLLKAEVTELQRAVKEREAAVANLIETLACKEEAVEVQRAAPDGLRIPAPSVRARASLRQSGARAGCTPSISVSPALVTHLAVCLH